LSLAVELRLAFGHPQLAIVDCLANWLWRLVEAPGFSPAKQYFQKIPGL
jgi:hypothetical protein